MRGKAAEAAYFNSVASGQFGCNCLQYEIDRHFGIRLREFGEAPCDTGNEFGFGHPGILWGLGIYEQLDLNKAMMRQPN